MQLSSQTSAAVDIAKAASVVPRENTDRPAKAQLGVNRSQLVAFIAMVACIIMSPSVIYQTFVMKMMCYALFACAFNLVLGYVGLLSFGHAAFFGTGCYVGAWTAKTFGVGPEVSLCLGGAAGATLGLAFGYIAIKRQGLYFAMITLALAQMTYFFFLQAPFAHGEDGIQQIPRGRLFGLVSLENDAAMYWFVAAVFLGGFLLIYRTVHSPFGQVLRGIRENEERAISLGYSSTSYKLIAFTLSAGLAAVAGAMKALVFSLATLNEVSMDTSSLVLLMALLGGLGTMFGPVVGAMLVVVIESELAALGSWVTIIQGLVFIGCVLTFKNGIVGEINRRFDVRL